MQSTTKYAPEVLENFRGLGDETADDVIRMIAENEDMGVLRDLFTTLATNELAPESSFNIFNHKIRTQVEDYFRSTRKLPSWADTSQFPLATSLFEIYGPEIMLVLVAYSLPFCYSCGKGARVLAQTGRLMKHDGSLDSITRRLVETAQFVVNMLSPGALTDEEANGIVSVQKVRLIHATIRHHILHRNGNFSEDEAYKQEVLGVPINQEDLAGTLMSFSVIILRGLEKLHVQVPQKQREAFVHYWNVIGSMIGVPEALLPGSYAQAEELTDAIFDHQAAYSREGYELSVACIDFMEYHTPGKRLDHIPLALVHFFCGSKVTGVLRLPPVDDKLKILSAAFFRSYESLQEDAAKSHFFRHLAGIFSRELIEGFLRVYNQGKQAQFHLPSSLSDYGRPLRFRKKLPVVPELKTVDQAISHLQEVTDYFKAENSHMGLFAAIYLLSTRRVAAGLENNEFEQPDVMHQVDVEFVSRYFDALNCYLTEQKPSDPWHIAFKAAAMKGLFVDQYIFAAANAHIDYDLGIAVAKVCPGEKIHAFKNDFYHMNEVFGGMYQQMNLDVGEIWAPFASLMKMAGRLIRNFENKIMVLGRTSAWDRAKRIALSEEAARAEVLRELEQSSVKIGEKILYPNWWMSSLLRYFARQEKGTVADKIDTMLRTNQLTSIN